MSQTTQPNTYSQPTQVASIPATAGEDPYAAFDKKQAEAEDKAMEDVMEIYSLLEKKNISMAYDYFKRNQIPLKTYIIKEAYDVLESTVLNAYNTFSQSVQ